MTDSLGEGGAFKTLVPAGATDLEVTLRDVADGAMLVVATNSRDPNQDPVELDLKLNSALAPATEIHPLPGTKVGLYMVTTTGITAIYLSNGGTVDMEATIVVAGD